MGAEVESVARDRADRSMIILCCYRDDDDDDVCCIIWIVNNMYKGGSYFSLEKGRRAVFDRIVDYLRAFCGAVSLSLSI